MAIDIVNNNYYCATSDDQGQFDWCHVDDHEAIGLQGADDDYDDEHDDDDDNEHDDDDCVAVAVREFPLQELKCQVSSGAATTSHSSGSCSYQWYGWNGQCSCKYF